MRRFGLMLEDTLYAEFYRLFPDHGLRTSILRKYVKRTIQLAKLKGYITPPDIDGMAEKIIEEEMGNG